MAEHSKLITGRESWDEIVRNAIAQGHKVKTMDPREMNKQYLPQTFPEPWNKDPPMPTRRPRTMGNRND
jgi:hypothetical protein